MSIFINIMTNVKLKNLKKLKLNNVLQRRGELIENFMKANSIVTFSDLCNVCTSLGVEQPEQEEYSYLFVKKPIIVRVDNSDHVKSEEQDIGQNRERTDLVAALSNNKKKRNKKNKIILPVETLVSSSIEK